MKSILLLFLLLSLQAHAIEPSGSAVDVPLVRKGLQAQSEMLAGQSTQVCESSYQEIFKSNSPEVRIALFYGYEDEKDVTTDGAFASMMIQHLQQPCTSNSVQACGFQVLSSDSGIVELSRQLKVGSETKSVVLTVAFPSVTWANRTNTDLQTGYWDQRKRSADIESRFYKAVKESQVVFYHGHARFGTGPGFKPETWVSEGFGRIRRKPFRQLLSTLSTGPNQIKLFGYFACESERYYLGELLQVAPDVGLIVTQEPVYSLDGEQAVLGALNSVLTRRCEADFEASLISVDHPARSRTQLKNFFK